MNRVGVAAAALLLAGGVFAREQAPVNLTTGGALRPGVYGRIAVKGAPPPLVYPKPVTVETTDKPRDPVYLYVPPGQLRRWDRHCAKWQACDRPVYFVRVDDSPSRLGAWKKTQRREPPALAWSVFQAER